MPGGTAVAYDWDFGDGTTGTGTTVTHRFEKSGVYTVELTVGSADGVRRSVSRELEVVGMAVQWERYFGSSAQGNDDLQARSVLNTPDGGSLLAGRFQSNYVSYVWITHLDRRGKQIWERAYETPVNGSETGVRIVASSSGGYIVCGGGEYALGFYFKIDLNGDLLWPVQVVPNTSAFSDVEATSDGGCVLAGSIETNGLPQPLVIKLSASGAQEWARVFDCERHRAEIAAPVADGYVALFSRNAYPDWIARLDISGRWLSTNAVHLYDSLVDIAERAGHAGEFTAVGEANKNILLRFYTTNCTPLESHEWSGPAVFSQNDYAYSFLSMPDGGYLLAGSMVFRDDPWGPICIKGALVRTDAAGNELWVEHFPASTNWRQVDVLRDAAVLTNGGFLLLGEHNRAAPNVWVFSVGPNFPPRAVMELSGTITLPEAPLTMDGTGCTDRDGTIAVCEWRFGDGTVAQGTVVTHSYAEPGAYQVVLTAVDNADGESSVTNEVFVSGVKGAGTGFNISGAVVTNCPACDPPYHPVPTAPMLVDWRNARGITILGTSISGSTKRFRVTFDAPVPEGLVLYRVPTWERITYTVIDKHTIELSLWSNPGPGEFRFLLGKAYRPPRLQDVRTAPERKLRFTVTTETGCSYRVRRCMNLGADAWEDVPWMDATSGTTRTTPILGTGSNVDVLIDSPATGGLFIRLELTL